MYIKNFKLSIKPPEKISARDNFSEELKSIPLPFVNIQKLDDDLFFLSYEDEDSLSIWIEENEIELTFNEEKLIIDIEKVIEHLLGQDYIRSTFIGFLETELYSEYKGEHQNYNNLLKYVPEGVKVEFLGFKYNTPSYNYRLTTYLAQEKIQHKTLTRFHSKGKTSTDIFISVINDHKENLFEVLNSLTDGVKK
ncbi:hypothetical protein ACSBO6_18655 [Bacillus sp. AL-1R]